MTENIDNTENGTTPEEEMDFITEIDHLSLGVLFVLGWSILALIFFSVWFNPIGILIALPFAFVSFAKLKEELYSNRREREQDRANQQTAENYEPPPLIVRSKTKRSLLDQIADVESGRKNVFNMFDPPGTA